MKLNNEDVAVPPANSTAVLVPQPDGLTISLPADGILRGSPRFYVVWRLGWIALTVLISLWLLFAPFLGNVPWDDSDQPLEPGLACLFLSPFWFIAAATLLVLFRNGRRRAWFAVTGDTLEIENARLTVEQRRWRAAELKDIRVVGAEEGDAMIHSVVLVIEPKQGRVYRLSHDRPKEELEWIATVLRQSLRLTEAALPRVEV
jgi:hypothetical protein